LAETEFRKTDHIRICVEEDVQAHGNKTGFDEVMLVHNALPEIALEDVDTSLTLFNHRLDAPIIIDSITGGTDEAAKINSRLAEAAETLGLAMAVGSQRVALENPKVVSTFQIVRKKAPHAFLMGNLGAPQLVKGYDSKDIKKAAEMIDADAFIIHLNPLQEAIQPEGNTSYKGVLERIKDIASNLKIPLLVKETGAGIASHEALLLEKAGVKGIDVSGAGGTSWAAVEYYRSKKSMDVVHAKLGEDFWDWGIPTVASIVEVSKSTSLTVIASGGVRTGIDVAKSISLGAEAAGLAQPLLKPALDGKVKESLQILIEEVKTAMFLVGADSIKALKSSPLIITGRTAEWLKARGFKPEEYARRTIR